MSAAFDMKAFHDAAVSNGCEVQITYRNDRPVFSLVRGNNTPRDLTDEQALDYIAEYERKKANHESELCNYDSKFQNPAGYYGLCPECHSEPEILNVGRNHFAVCRDHKIYWPVGSNLFSNWRNDEPEAWERNKQFLAICTLPKPQSMRPPLGSLGDCLQETASYQPLGYTRIVGCTQSFWRDIPADRPDTPWFVMEAVTAALDPAPVTIFIRANTPAATAREILKQVSRWLKEHGDELPSLTPREPEPTAGDSENIPF